MIFSTPNNLLRHMQHYKHTAHLYVKQPMAPRLYPVIRFTRLDNRVFLEYSEDVEACHERKCVLTVKDLRKYLSSCPEVIHVEAGLIGHEADMYYIDAILEEPSGSGNFVSIVI